ncbi:MAG: hypothetical protein Q9168_002443 [Polycauliona sp. 1 TL-2023]
MISPIGMETFEARLESFQVVHQGSKKRTSNSKSAPKLKWSHTTPDPTQLAKAGFYYNPKASAPDNTTCYLCHENLDGWEEDDNAIEEHANLSPGCGWAAIVRIEKNVEDGASEHGDPLDEKLLDARRMTFGANWPHENKRGWICKTDKDFSMVDVNNIAEISMSENVDSSAPKKSAKEAKRGTKARKAAPKPKGRASASQQEVIVVGSSFIEPEDDDFAVKISPEPNPNERTKKRKSDEMSVDGESTQAGMAPDHSQFPLPPPKRRATRASASQGHKDLVSTLEFTLDTDTHMEDGESLPQPSQPKAKKAAKGGKKRASSSVRKASSTSTATKASLRAAVPNDEELDAALEADLDRPLTDDEGDSEPAPIPKTKTRRLTKTRPGSRKVTASTAPVRRTTRASILPVESDSIMSTDAPMSDAMHEVVQGTKALDIALNAVEHAKEEIIAETIKHTASKAKTRGRPPSKTTRGIKEIEKKTDNERDLRDTQAGTGESEATTGEPTETRSNHTSENLAAEPSPPEVPVQDTGIDSSMVAPLTAHDEPASESGTKAKPQARVRGGGKIRANTGAKKSKAIRKDPPEVQESEDVIRVEQEDFRKHSPEPAVELEIQHNDHVTEEPTRPKQLTIEETTRSVEEAVKPKKGRPAKAKAKPRKPITTGSFIEPTEPAEISPVAAPEQVDITETIPATNHEVRNDTTVISPQAATPPKTAASVHGTPKTAISPQSSDAENQPPSSRPSALRPPLATQSPSKAQTTRVVLAASTPTASPSKRNISRLQSTLPWTSIDFEKLFMASPAAEKENIPLTISKDAEGKLTSPEKKLTVEEWIRFNAQRGEDKLRDDCERLVGRFEGEGVRALKTLEGIVCAE